MTQYLHFYLHDCSTYIVNNTVCLVCWVNVKLNIVFTSIYSCFPLKANFFYFLLWDLILHKYSFLSIYSFTFCILLSVGCFCGFKWVRKRDLIYQLWILSVAKAYATLCVRASSLRFQWKWSTGPSLTNQSNVLMLFALSNLSTLNLWCRWWSFFPNETSLYPHDVIGTFSRFTFLRGGIVLSDHNDVIFTWIIWMRHMLIQIKVIFL